MPSANLVQTSFDSARLSRLASIAHPMREPGHWRLEAHGARGLRVQAFDIIVREGGAPRVAVDVAPTNPADQSRAVGDRLLAPHGMINLSISAGGGGAFALLYGARASEPVWDSRVLEPGDHYACMPLRPGSYVVSNVSGDARAALRVNYPDPRAIAQGNRLASGPVHLKIGRAITPGDQRIDPGQVLVFAIETRSHLSVALETADDGPPDLAEWRAARNRDCLRAAFAYARRRK